MRDYFRTSLVCVVKPNELLSDSTWLATDSADETLQNWHEVTSNPFYYHATASQILAQYSHKEIHKKSVTR
jgi:hypothetical protein